MARVTPAPSGDHYPGLPNSRGAAAVQSFESAHAMPEGDVPPGGLFAPLDQLLTSGGDTRLQLDPASLLNGYGCRPFPRGRHWRWSVPTSPLTSG